MRRLGYTLRWLHAYFRANLQAALEYRTSFASEVIAMIINDAMWASFWVVFYERYPAVNGWQRAQVVTLWAVNTTAFGLANAFCGNGLRLAGVIARAELDLYLALPRPVLVHTLIGRMSISALGDIAFGAGIFAWFAADGVVDVLLFAVLVVSAAAVWLGFAVLISSAGFWLNNAETLTQLGTTVLMSTSTFPMTIFHGGMKLVLYSLLPAAFMGFVPVEVLRRHELSWLLAQIGVAGAFLWLGSALFRRGLRRYESGNLLTVRL